MVARALNYYSTSRRYNIATSTYSFITAYTNMMPHQQTVAMSRFLNYIANDLPTLSAPAVTKPRGHPPGSTIRLPTNIPTTSTGIAAFNQSTRPIPSSFEEATVL